jgi:ribosomal protein S18 acetylase RimI-like enzyme
MPSMKSCHFRPFEEALDKETVKGFLADTLRIGCDEPVSIEENAANYFAAVERAQSRDRRFCSMLLEGDEAIGFVDVFTMPKKPGSGLMRFCYVVPEKRGCGVSDLIVDYCVELMSEYGCSEILLDVRADNKRAVGLYARHGWIVREEKQEGFLRMGRILKARKETNAGCDP